MTTRPRRTTTLVGPNRVAIGAATGGLVVLASAGTALLIVTGTSSVTPLAAPPPPLPTSAPLADAPGVVVLPSQPGSPLPLARGHRSVRLATSPVLRTAAVAAPLLPAPSLVSLPGTTPVALAFTDVAAPPAPPAGVAAAPLTRQQLKALRKARHSPRASVDRSALADLIASLTTPRTAALVRIGSVPLVAPTSVESVPATKHHPHAAKQKAKHADSKHAKHEQRAEHADSKHAKHEQQAKQAKKAHRPATSTQERAERD